MAGLLPGSERWPGAVELDLSSRISRLLEENQVAARSWSEISEWTLPPRSDLERLTAGLREYERTAPDVFAQGLLLVFSAYYSHPDVLRIVEEVSGYPSRPPQPLGHQVLRPGPDPEPSSIGAMPMWRDDGTQRSREVRAQQAQDPERMWTEEEIATWPM